MNCILPTIKAEESDELSTYADNIKEVYIERYPNYQNVIENIVNELILSDEMKACFETDGESSLRIIESAIVDALTPATSELYMFLGKTNSNESASTFAVNPSNGLYYAPHSITPLVQSTGYYCGPAATLQALVGNGKIAQSSCTASKQQSVASSLGTTSSDGTNISNIKNYMNTQMGYNSSSRRYTVKAFTRYSYDKALYYIRDSLAYDACPIYRISDTSCYSYYNNYSYTHYVTIAEYNSYASTLLLVDPNHIRNSSGNLLFNGNHSISFSEFEDCIYDCSYNASKDTFIVVRTADYSSGSFEYIY